MGLQTHGMRHGVLDCKGNELTSGSPFSSVSQLIKQYIDATAIEKVTIETIYTY